MKVYIIRHGETDLNKQRLLQGRFNSQLNDEGRGQAKDCAAWLKEHGITFDRVYASPLDRAQETAEIATGTPRGEIITDERIIEIGFGPYEMLSYETLDDSMMAYFRNPMKNPAPEGMETIEELVARASDFMEALKAVEHEAGIESVAIVTHGVTIRTLMAYLNNQTFEEGWDLMVGNCDIFFTECVDGVYRNTARIRTGATKNEA